MASRCTNVLACGLPIRNLRVMEWRWRRTTQPGQCLVHDHGKPTWQGICRRAASSAQRWEASQMMLVVFVVVFKESPKLVWVDDCACLLVHCSYFSFSTWWTANGMFKLIVDHFWVVWRSCMNDPPRPVWSLDLNIYHWPAGMSQVLHVFSPYLNRR